LTGKPTPSTPASAAAAAVAGHGAPADPYRIFFPLGIVLGTAGVSIWPLYWLGVTARYSGRAHAFVQTEGFLYAFVAGFLLTAVPRFTGTAAPSVRVQWPLAAALAAAAAAFEVEAFLLGHTVFLLVHSTVIVLLVRRVRRRRSAPPDGFALVGLGMLAGAAGAAVNVAVAAGWLAPTWDLLGRRLLTEGMVLLLVLGVGGFLGPRLMGFAALPEFKSAGVSAAGLPPLLAGKRVTVYAAAGASIVLSLVIEDGLHVASMAALRAAIATLLMLYTIKPWALPAVRTTLAWCVWSAHWFLIVGLWLAALAPAYRVDFLHVVFMGGFTLLVLAVGTRVVLSHGGHPLSRERRSWALRIGIATGLAALSIRLGAAFAPDSFFLHLGVAALVWIAGMSVWGTHIVRLITRRAVPKAEV
jgi:uncharacterized protein involved in response to NO